MAEDDRPGYGDQEDFRYYGPFGPPPSSAGGGAPGGTGPGAVGTTGDPSAPLGIGHWSYAEDDQPTTVHPPVSAGDTQVLPAQPGPSYASSPTQGGPGQQPWSVPLYPAPSGVPPLRPGPPEQLASSVPPRPRRQLRAAPLIAGAALTALVVGSAAGYGGARLAERADPGAQTSAQPGPSASQLPTPSAPSGSFSPAPGQANTVAVAKAALPSSVMIQVGSGTSGGTGSGFVLDTQGHIMTNNHVVEAAGAGGAIRVIFSDGARTTATLVGRSPSYDLAVIQVGRSSRVKPIRIGDSQASQVGEPVIAIGSPLALPGTVTAGIVSAKDRPVVVNESEDADAPSAYINAIQTDAPINPGNSGGPLVDAQARVIGVNSAILTLGENRGQSGSIGLGFAIPINQALTIGTLLIKNGKATYPVIGASVSSDETGEGVKLTTVEAGGPAATAGLEAGDVVSTIDGRSVTDMQELIVAIRTHRPGEQVTLGYQRAGTRGSAEVTLGSKDG